MEKMAGRSRALREVCRAKTRSMGFSLTTLPGLLLLPGGLLDQHLHHYLLCFKEARDGEGPRNEVLVPTA